MPAIFPLCQFYSKKCQKDYRFHGPDLFKCDVGGKLGFKALSFSAIVLFLFFPICIHAQTTEGVLPNLVKSTINPSTVDEGHAFFTLQNQIRIIGFLTLISLIPFGVMMMTSFTRISIIFQFLRQALGSSQVPSNQIIIGLSLILTGFIMHPVIHDVRENALTPYFEGKFRNLASVQSKKKSEESVLLERAWNPLRKFLLRHTREKDLELFLSISNLSFTTNGNEEVSGVKSNDEIFSEYDFKEIPWYCLVPSFIMSELRTAFMMGFLLFLPFLIIDMVVSSVLMSMGMMMLPPVMVSTPFKLLLFILIDGWRLIIQQIVTGFHPIG
jgi:flagellar biosynthesis protein FliP